jgi:hypothetical protein
VSYREEFIKKVNIIFETETKAYKRREKAYDFITEYFGDLLDELDDETEASEEQLDIEYERIRFKDRELQVEFGKGAISICMNDINSGEKKTIDLLEDNGHNYISKKHNSPLGEEILDQYLKEAFAETLG